MQEVEFLRSTRACLHQLPAPRMQKKRKETKQVASAPIKTCRVVNSVVRLVSQTSVISATEAALRDPHCFQIHLVNSTEPGLLQTEKWTSNPSRCLRAGALK